MVIHSEISLNSHLMIMPRPQIEAILSDAGLEMTPQRFAVLEYLVRSAEPPTADEILEKLQRLYPRPSRESIRKLLQTLRDAALISEEVIEDSVPRYRVNFDPEKPLVELEDD